MTAHSQDSQSTQIKNTQSLFGALWADYTAFNPRAKQIYDVLLKHEQTVQPKTTHLVNDHVALRTYNHPRVSESVLAEPFLKLGYERKGEYFFKQKKLYARHYEAPTPDLPKVFISELKLEECSDLVRQVANEIVDSLTDDTIHSASFLYSRRSWKVSHATYEKLLEESEYAAWLYAFGYRANHFTVSFNHLKAFSSLEKLDEFIKANRYELNQSGGEIKGTPEQLLEQSSTLAELTKVEFIEGVKEIPACYYEFARRYPMASGELYQGFIAASADKIFESTNVRR